MTSRVPRAVETALAMGCAVDETVEFPDWYREPSFPKHAQWTWPDPFAELRRRLCEDAELRAVAAAHLSVWTAAVSACADGGSALVVGHGGAVELTLVAALPHAPTAGWGPPLTPGEGVRLEFRDGGFTALRFLSADGHVDVSRAGWDAPAPGVVRVGTGDRS
ncbi:histidine phosphatase family protein [Kineococcus sp. DHX-1]|uniref:histidine phosphatase family protein n=1 Tax=Kineococcus sp. DHX-1 TaxID=3349638 RepID=UPI0036D2F9A8